MRKLLKNFVGFVDLQCVFTVNSTLSVIPSSNFVFLIRDQVVWVHKYGKWRREGDQFSMHEPFFMIRMKNQCFILKRGHPQLFGCRAVPPTEIQCTSLMQGCEHHVTYTKCAQLLASNALCPPYTDNLRLDLSARMLSSLLTFLLQMWKEMSSCCVPFCYG